MSLSQYHQIAEQESTAWIEQLRSMGQQNTPVMVVLYDALPACRERQDEPFPLCVLPVTRWDDQTIDSVKIVVSPEQLLKSGMYIDRDGYLVGTGQGKIPVDTAFGRAC